MNILTGVAVALTAYFIIRTIKKPHEWIDRINLLPIMGFMWYMRFAGMNEMAWPQAFIFSGLIALGVVIILVHNKVIMNRLRLGVNLFLIIGGLAFLFHNEALLKWYASTKGGPFFGCIAIVGLLTTLFTPSGFLGNPAKNRYAIRYGSLLLLGATIIAWVWAVQNDGMGLLQSVVIPFLLLILIRDQLDKHL
jgi:hypothetical protein